jgi:6-phosphogluconolactonase
MPNPVLTVCRDADDLARHAAELFVDTARQALAARGRFSVALAGGSTPEKTYALLARPERSGQLDWNRVLVFFGDERCVPYDDPRSNYGMARRSLLAAVPVPEDNVFPIPTDGPPAGCAEQYAATLAGAFGVPPDAPPGGPPPRFDLILLGLGDDGHTASLFPGAKALGETRAWVSATPPGTLPPPVDRVTLTYPVLNAARQVVFLVAGTNKAAVLGEVLEGGAPPHVHPAAGVRPSEGSLTWLIDEAAAARLTRRSR